MSSRVRRWGLGGLLAAIAYAAIAYADGEASALPAVQDGDIIFQVSKSRQGKAIQAATGSPYTHMGLILHRGDGKPLVYEAVQPSKATPLRAWINRGRRKHYVVMRVKAPHRARVTEGIARLRSGAASLLGRDYDLRFEWSDDALYCSEYVWKVYKRALDIEIGEPERWADLDMQRPEARRLAKKRLGHMPDPRGMIITPVRMLESPLLEEVAKTPLPLELQ